MMRSSEYNRFGVLMGTSWPASCPRSHRLQGDFSPMITLILLEAVRKLMSNKSTSWKSLKAWQETDYPISPFLALHCLWHKILPYKGFVSRQPLTACLLRYCGDWQCASTCGGDGRWGNQPAKRKIASVHTLVQTLRCSVFLPVLSTRPKVF